MSYIEDHHDDEMYEEYLKQSIMPKVGKSDKQLTSVKVDPKLFEEFKIHCVKYKFSLQKLTDRAIHLFISDPEFRKMITNHTDISIK